MSDAAQALDRDTSSQRNRICELVLQHLCRRMTCGALNLEMPGGAVHRHRTGRPGPDATLVVHAWRTLRRLLVGGDVGFGESFVDGDWSSPDPVALLEIALRSSAAVHSAVDDPIWARVLNMLLHRLRPNTLAGSRRNIVEHYDLGNDFYRLWLDRGMSYSSALYAEPTLSLEAAQRAKQDRVITLLEPEPTHSVLEIGCGWGGMAQRLAQSCRHVTGLTLSPAQRAHAAEALAAAGLSGRVDIRLQDYREAGGRFDRIVSIEMLEAVGEAYWQTYFDRVRELLTPGGVAVLQVITIDDSRFDVYRRQPDFVQRHIFPGGMLPSPRMMRLHAARAGLDIDVPEMFGASYVRTLQEWRARFIAAWPAIAALGFSARFRRLWEYYLAYCEAGFRVGTIDVGLWRLRRPA
ncbi:MAG TPA: cyclopropane-fatty-acyl-phospholipid synthase family protein [Methylomirabilota bacterium]|nr:cyclopropane-fatty-acyl-phospholipid synthase family protein [Methylomirabilota bacterium]